MNRVEDTTDLRGFTSDGLDRIGDLLKGAIAGGEIAGAAEALE